MRLLKSFWPRIGFKICSVWPLVKDLVSKLAKIGQVQKNKLFSFLFLCVLITVKQPVIWYRNHIWVLIKYFKFLFYIILLFWPLVKQLAFSKKLGKMVFHKESLCDNDTKKNPNIMKGQLSSQERDHMTLRW